MDRININGTPYTLITRIPTANITNPVTRAAYLRTRAQAEVTLCKVGGTRLHWAIERHDGTYTAPLALRRRVDGTQVR